MVATAPRYRSDPDGVIHINEDDDFNEPNNRYEQVVDLTDYRPPVGTAKARRKSRGSRRDPPTEPGSPIHEIKSMVSDAQLSDIDEEVPDRSASPSITAPYPPEAKPNNITYPVREEYGTPAFSGEDIQEVISVESAIIKGIASPEEKQTDLHQDYATSETRSDRSNNIKHRVQNIKAMHKSRKQREQPSLEVHDVEVLKETKYEAKTLSPRYSSEMDDKNRNIVDDDRFDCSKDGFDAQNIRVDVPPSPNDVEDDAGMAEGTYEILDNVRVLDTEALQPSHQNAKAKTSYHDEQEAKEAHISTRNYADDDEERDSPEKATAPEEEKASGNDWIFSGFLNTFSCRGPQPETSGPFGIVSCGKMSFSDKKGEHPFPQDDEDANSVLGPKAFGDLASLPSLEDSILQKDGDTDNESLSSRHSRASMQTEYLGNAVDTKMKHIEMEKRLEEQDAGEESGPTMDPDVQRIAKELNDAARSFGPHHVKCAELTAELAKKYTEQKSFKKALELQKTVVTIYSTKLGDHHSQTLNSKLRLGKCLEDAEEYDESISVFYEVMAMRRSLRGEKDPSASDALVQIANCLRKKGQYIQAIRELKRALKVYRESLGDSHPSVASTVDEIASLYVVLGDFDKSAAILEEVVKLKAATLGMQNKQVASSLVELATSYECSEDFDRAVKALKKAYKIYTDIDGFSCEEATSTLHRIALIYQASGDINKAAIAYLGVLRGKKHLLGDDHLEVAETYYRLGVCLRETNQLDKALKCMKEALPILVGKGKNIHDVDMIAEVMHEMALLYKAKKQLNEAAKIFKQELTVRRKIGQPDYPCIAKTLNHLGVTEYEMKMHRRALKHLLEVLTIFQERQEQGIDFAEALYNIGLVFEAVRNKERAYEAFLEAARVFKANGYANDHPHLVKAVNKVKRLSKK